MVIGEFSVGTLGINGRIALDPRGLCFKEFKRQLDYYNDKYEDEFFENIYTIKVDGTMGTKAGDGGDGGKQGDPGLAGKLLLINLYQASNLKTYTNDGMNAH